MDIQNATKSSSVPGGNDISEKSQKGKFVKVVKWSLSLTILVIIVSIIIGIYYFVLRGRTEFGKPVDKKITDYKFTDFIGDAVQARLPTDWSIEETFIEIDKAKAWSSQRQGLTQLVIKNADDESVFSITAYTGHDSQACDKIYQFEDTDGSYVKDLLEKGVMKTWSGEEYYGDIIDVTGEEYQEFELFGLLVRRMPGLILVDTEEDENIFNPACVLPAKFFDLEGLYYYTFYKDKDQLYEASSYSLKITTYMNDEEEELLSQILMSMEGLMEEIGTH